MPTTPLSRLLYVSKALASRARLRILATLEGRELNVGQVAAVFEIAYSTASEHLSELRRVGLVIGSRDGQLTHYSLGVDEDVRRFVDVVLSELSTDPAVLSDRERAERLVALPHDYVGAQGHAALRARAGPDGAAVHDKPSSCSTSRPKTNRQEVP